MTSDSSEPAENSGDEPEGLDGHTIEELNDYLDRDRTPSDESIDNSPGCQLALAALDRLRGLTRTILDRDALAEPECDDSWVASILANLTREVSAGRDIPITHDSPNARLSVSEGAVRGMIRAAGDSVGGIVTGRCRLEGDVTVLGEPIIVLVEANAFWADSLADAEEDVRRAVRAEIERHTDLNITAIDVTIEDASASLATTEQQMPDPETVSTDLTELVQSTPGVRIVYDAASTIGRVIDKVVDFVTGRESDTNPVVVKDPKSGTQVRVSIGVSGDESASAVCRRVHDAVAAYLEQQGDEATEISVKVSSIG